ncbi:MAG: CopG family ribbon-helix-helix protein [Acidilobaceae archaeon]
MAKKRFGVSVSRSLAESLDMVAGMLGLDRSSVVELALRGLLEDYTHHVIPHDCVALIAHICDRDLVEVATVIGGYGELRITQLHSHTGEKCIQILLVSGSSSVIADFYSKLAKLKGCRVKYMPLHEISEVARRS